MDDQTKTTDQMKCEKCQHVHDKEDGTCKCGCLEGKKEDKTQDETDETDETKT